MGGMQLCQQQCVMFEGILDDYYTMADLYGIEMTVWERKAND